MTTREQKIAFGEMRTAGVRQVLIYCSDYKCGHCNIVADDADRWPNELRISDIEHKFVCTACGQRGADIRPDWTTAVDPKARQASVRTSSRMTWRSKSEEEG